MRVRGRNPTAKEGAAARSVAASLTVGFLQIRIKDERASWQKTTRRANGRLLVVVSCFVFARLASLRLCVKCRFRDLKFTPSLKARQEKTAKQEDC